ncbi:MAG: hypothetical protein CBD26_04010 [Candidatus Pelagibacter sp. TMED166]|nr:MAG: hypothetical protein CBD26_04010 [Candidatus Pelagibacter sp. TMED166]|tara:strand:+ start:1399 stop:1899 length:501 start_codon:yes stop_codon:yes gene_type:complete
MENEEKINFATKIQNLVQNNKKIIITVFVLIVLVFISVVFFKNYQSSKNEKISEKFIQAELLLSLNKEAESKKIYTEIVLSKNKFYSLLALNEIIDNNLEENSEEILKLFEIIEKIRVEREQKNLFKMKKALYLMKISKNDEGKKLLNEIISDNSIWKETASEVSK